MFVNYRVDLKILIVKCVSSHEDVFAQNKYATNKNTLSLGCMQR